MDLRSSALICGFVIAGAIALHWPAVHELHIGSDDRAMMAASRDVAAGRWARLLDPQGDHFLPLFRLLRLPFDLHFPAAFPWFYFLTLAAHAAAILLLYALSRPRLGPWGSLTAAAVFGWNGLAAEAFIIHSQNTYIWSLLCVLAALAGLLHFQPIVCALALTAALSFDTTPVLAAVPALLAARRLFSPALPAGSIWGPAALGAAAWLAGTAPSLGPLHVGPVSRAWDGLHGALLHYGFLLRHAPPEPWVLVAGAASLAAVLILLPARRWLFVTLVLTALPTWTILSFRGSAGYQTSRYFYLSALLLATAAGALAAHPRLRRAAPVGLLVLAPLYFRNQRAIVQRKVVLLRFAPSTTREFWIAWHDFFQRTPGLRLPAVEVEPNLSAGEVFALLRPRGRPGVIVLLPGEETRADCSEFARQLDLFFSGPPLPPYSTCGTPMAKRKGGVDVRATGRGRVGDVPGRALPGFLPVQRSHSADGHPGVVLGRRTRAIRRRRLHQDPGAPGKADGRLEPVQGARRHLASRSAGRPGPRPSRARRRLRSRRSGRQGPDRRVSPHGQ